jgi:hypothetical protein
VQFQTTLPTTYTIGIAPLHAGRRADGTPARYLHDSPVMIAPEKIQNPSYDQAITGVFEGRGTALYWPPTAAVQVGSKRSRRLTRGGAYKRRMAAYATCAPPTGSALAGLSGCYPYLLTPHPMHHTYSCLEIIFIAATFHFPLPQNRTSRGIRFVPATRPLQSGGLPAKNVKIPKNPAGERREQRGTPPRRSGGRRG